ncbi:MAG: transposase, partial [Dehalococcoidia bacterium]|nr:transposase [Dehalococcoidia bacterium]
SERYYQKMGRTHKRITDWAHQMILQLRRWLPNRPIVVVADSSYAALDLLHFCQSMAKPVTFITRLRLDAALYEPAPTRLPGQMGRPRLKGQRLPTLKELLDRPDTRWFRASVAWYDDDTRTVELSSHTALWYHTGKSPVSIRWVMRGNVISCGKEMR